MLAQYVLVSQRHNATLEEGRVRIKIAWLLMVCLCEGLLSACSSTASVERRDLATGDPYVDFLEEFGWTPEGEQTVQPVTIPQLEDLNRPGEPFNLYLKASQAIGRDFIPWAGQEVQLRIYFLGREPTENLNVYGHLLVDGQLFLGAWVSVKGQDPSVHPLNTDIKNLVLSSP